MADGITMLRVKSIIESDAARRYVVVSAPGKRFGGDIKVTDLLYETCDSVVLNGETGPAYEKICERFRGIVSELGLSLDIDAILAETGEAIVRESSPDFCASRGEYLAGRVMAALLDVPFIDARDVVKFGPDGRLDNKRTYALLAEALRGKKRAVVSGFYGEDAQGRVKTFSRGGSDISGAIVARAAGADLYENWTDVSGFLACDPRMRTSCTASPSSPCARRTSPSASRTLSVPRTRGRTSSRRRATSTAGGASRASRERKISPSSFLKNR